MRSGQIDWTIATVVTRHQETVSMETSALQIRLFGGVDLHYCS